MGLLNQDDRRLRRFNRLTDAEPGGLEARFSPGTPLSVVAAAEAAIAAGDEIVAVDGTAAHELSGWDMRRIMRKEVGTKLTLEIRRAGQMRSVIVTLRELLF